MSRAFHHSPGRESARSQAEYATVKGILAQRTEGAILLVPTDKPAQWVPLQALNTSGRVAVHRASLNSEIEIGVELKLALKKHLV